MYIYDIHSYNMILTQIGL